MVRARNILSLSFVNPYSFLGSLLTPASFNMISKCLTHCNHSWRGNDFFRCCLWSSLFSVALGFLAQNSCAFAYLTGECTKDCWVSCVPSTSEESFLCRSSWSSWTWLALFSGTVIRWISEIDTAIPPTHWQMFICSPLAGKGRRVCA